MEFIFYSYLWLLPLSSIPILIHIFNKRNTQTIEFSSIKFLKLIESDSINKLKILQLLLLIIRTLIILFIILMMSRPVVKGFYGNIISEEDSTLSIVFIDDTASNEGSTNKKNRSIIIESYINEILDNINSNSNILIISQSNGLVYRGLKKNIIDFYPIKISQLTGKMFDRINNIDQYINQEYLNKELYIISDGEKSFLKDIELLKDKIKNYYIYFIQIPKLINNYSIIDVSISNENITVDTPIDFNVTVKNTGSKIINNALLELKIDDVNVGQQLVTLEKGKTEIFTFRTSLPSTGKHKCYITLANDDNNIDNSYYYIINIPEKLKLFLSTNKNIYLNEILTSIKKTTNNIDFIYNNQNNINLQEQDIVFIDNKTNVKTSLLKAFLRDGGHIIFFPNKNNETLPSYLLEINNIDLSNNFIKNNNNSFNIINFKSKALPFITNNNTDIINNIKFYKYIELDNNINSMLSLTDDISIWNRYEIGNGILDIFGFSNDLTWTNLPIKGSYTSFMNQLIYSSYNQKLFNVKNGYILKPNLHTSNLNEFIFYNSNDRNQNIVNIKKSDILLLEKGFHNISNGNTILTEIASNIKESELKNIILEKDIIKSYFPKNYVYVSDDISNSIQKSKYGQELWRVFLYLIIVLIIIEMILSNGKKFQEN